MHKIIDIINQFGPKIQLIVFVSLFVLLWNVENVFGFLIGYKKWKHAVVNFPFVITDIPVQFFMGYFFVKTIEWTGKHHFGLMGLIHLTTHPFVYFMISFMMLDLGEYVYHIFMHKFKRFWMFHLVHHSDQVLDVTTTLREHPGETLIRLLFTLLWVFIGGISMWALLLRQLTQALVTPIVHMNYRLPEKTDRLISLIFVTPNFHQVHHHYKQPYTDCNYGDVLSIWDRLFGTLKRIPVEYLKFGVDTYMEKDSAGKFGSLISIPFGKYRKVIPSDSENLTQVHKQSF